jgi:hypothetical protein
MVDIAKKELLVETNDIYISDANIAIEKLIIKKEKYDLILIDVY